MNKNDFLKDCISDPALVRGPVPIDAFQQQYCVKCGNTDCQRSWGNQSEYMKRTSTWESRLFDNVPRALDTDSSYDGIRSKRFVSLEEAPMIWNPGIQKSNPVFQEVSPEKVDSPSPIFTPPESPPAPPIVVVQSPVSPNQEVPENTPFIQGTFIGKKDEGEKVLEPGSDFTFESNE